MVRNNHQAFDMVNWHTSLGVVFSQEKITLHDIDKFMYSFIYYSLLYGPFISYAHYLELFLFPLRVGDSRVQMRPFSTAFLSLLHGFELKNACKINKCGQKYLVSTCLKKKKMHEIISAQSLYLIISIQCLKQLFTTT